MMRRRHFPTAVVLLPVLVALSCASLPTEPAAVPGPSPSRNRATELVQGAMQPGSSATAAPAAAQPTASSQTAVSQPALPPASGTAAMAAEDRAAEAFLADLPNYLARLTFMVYWKPDSGLDPRIARMAAAQAGRWLKEKSSKDGSFLTVIDAEQIERNRADQAAVYQSSTGQGISMVQYLAGRFNANVYIEIDYAVKTEARESGWAASVQGSLTMLDVATASVLGTVPFQNMGFWPGSEQDAAANVVVASVWNAMPRVYEQARQLATAQARRGLRYEVTVQDSSDSRKFLAFEKYLQARVREVQELSFSAAESRLNVYSFQPKAALRQLILDAAAASGMPDFDLVMARDNSFTFDSGL